MDVNRLLDETTEKSVNLDGWLSRRASLKIQRARGSALPGFVRKSMKGMTENQRRKYRKLILKKRKAKAILSRRKKDAQSKMKRAIIQRKIRNKNALESWKERRKVNMARAKLARIKSGIAKSIARKNTAERKALVVRNATHPGTIMARTEKARVNAGRTKSSQIMKNKMDIFRPGREQRSAMTNTRRVNLRRRLEVIRRRRENRKRGRRPKPRPRRPGWIKTGKKRIPNKSGRGRAFWMTSHPQTQITQVKFAGIGGLGRLTPTQCETLRAKIKQDFLQTVAKARATNSPSDKVNVMRIFWGRWQPVLSNKPQFYNWFVNDQHIKNAQLDLKGLGEWDEFTPEEAQYLQGTTTDEERSFLLGDDRPGVIDSNATLHPIADGLWDVEDLMPNVPTPQPDLSSIGSGEFFERFDIENLMPGVPNIEPMGVELPNAHRKKKEVN